VIGVAQIINKITGNHEFEEQDVEVSTMWITLFYEKTL
jgi:hypothetical protein